MMPRTPISEIVMAQLRVVARGPSMEEIPPPNGRSAREESAMAAGMPFWSLEACVLGFEPCGGAGARE
jgi:hypothetical protein